MSTRTGMAKTTTTSMSATMLSRGLRLDTMIRFKHATKIARFLTCSGKSAVPNPNALGGDMASIDCIHLGCDTSGSGEASRLLMPRTLSSAPIVALMTPPTVETMLSAPPKRTRPEIPITAQVVKYPSARAAALRRGLRDPRNSMVRSSNGGAIDPDLGHRDGQQRPGDAK